jgi:UDP-glucose 4-epimerase
MRIKDARQNFLGIWVRRVVEGDVFEVWGGQQKRDLTFIDDAVEAFLLAASTSPIENGVFNIGGSPPISLAELGEVLITIAGKGRYEFKQFPPDRLRIDLGDYFADDSLFRKATGWAPKFSLSQALARTVEFYMDRLSDYV